MDWKRHLTEEWNTNTMLVETPASHPDFLQPVCVWAVNTPHVRAQSPPTFKQNPEVYPSYHSHQAGPILYGLTGRCTDFSGSWFKQSDLPVKYDGVSPLWAQQ